MGMGLIGLVAALLIVTNLVGATSVSWAIIALLVGLHYITRVVYWIFLGFGLMD